MKNFTEIIILKKFFKKKALTTYNIPSDVCLYFYKWEILIIKGQPKSSIKLVYFKMHDFVFFLSELSFILKAERWSNFPNYISGWLKRKKLTLSSNAQAQALYLMPYLYETAATALARAVLLDGKSGGIIFRFSHSPSCRVVLRSRGRVPACCQWGLLDHYPAS